MAVVFRWRVFERHIVVMGYDIFGALVSTHQKAIE